MENCHRQTRFRAFRSLPSYSSPASDEGVYAADLSGEAFAENVRKLGLLPVATEKSACF